MTFRVRLTVYPYDVEVCRPDDGWMDASARDDAMPRCRARCEIVEHGARAPLRATCATLVEGARALPVRDACERDECRE